MKAQDLAKMLMEYPDHEVKLSFFDKQLSDFAEWPTFRQINVTGIADIGYSDKVVILDGNDD